MKNNKKKKYLIILFLLLLGLSVGFALLQANLKINGSSKIQGSSWDIHFENLNVTSGSVALSTGDVAAAIQSSRTDITYTVTLNLPGDYYEFTVDAVNSGTVDGMVESVTSKFNNEPITTLPNYLKYSVTYETDDEIQVNHLLKAGDSETYKVRIEYKRDIISADMPTTTQTLSMSFGVVYVQADSNGVEVDHPLNGIVYTVNKYDSSITEPKNNSVWLNQTYPKTILFYETPAEALNAIGSATGKNLPFYLKHKVENDIVTEQYVEFVISESLANLYSGMIANTYTLKPEKTLDNGSSIYGLDYISVYYETNKEILKTAFGYENDSSRCYEERLGRSLLFRCSVNGFGAEASSRGTVASDDNSGSSCGVSDDGYAHCSWQ